MAVRCEKCKHVIEGKEGVHTVSTCPNCGNTDKDMFIRVEDDIDPEEYEKTREWLESRRTNE